MEKNDNLTQLHNTLVKDGYDMPSLEQFRKDMQDENNLREMHTTLSKDGYDMPSLDQFKADMGYGSAAQAANPVEQAKAGADVTKQENADDDGESWFGDVNEIIEQARKTGDEVKVNGQRPGEIRPLTAEQAQAARPQASFEVGGELTDDDIKQIMRSNQKFKNRYTKGNVYGYYSPAYKEGLVKADNVLYPRMEAARRKIDTLSVEEPDFKSMTEGDLVKMRNELVGKYQGVDPGESDDAMRDALLLQGIDQSIIAKRMGFSDYKEMNRNAGKRDMALLGGTMKPELLEKYRGKTNLGDNPLYTDGWELLNGMMEKDGGGKDADDYINDLLKQPGMEDKFYAWALARADKSNKAVAEVVDEAIDDFRESMYKGYEKWKILDPEGDALKGAKDELEGELKDIKKGIEAWDKRFSDWKNKNDFHFGDTSPDQYYERGTNDYLGTWTTAENLIKGSYRLVNEAIKERNDGDNMTSFLEASLRGMGATLSNIDTWTFGITDMQSQGYIAMTADKYMKGEKLSEGEQKLMDALAMKLVIEELTKKYIGHGYKAGQMTGDAVPFIIEMLNPLAKGVGLTTKAATKGVGNAVQAAAKWATRKFSSSIPKAVAHFAERLGLKTAMKGIAKFAEKSAVKGAVNTAGKVIGKAAEIAGTTAGMTGTTGAPKVIADTSRRMMGEGQVGYDQEKKKLYITGFANAKSAGRALFEATANQGIEYASEMVGEFFKPFAKFVGKLTGKGARKVGLGGLLDAVNNLKGGSFYKILQDFRKNVHYDGSFGEYMEEVVGNIANAIMVGDQNFALHDKDGNFSLHEENSVFNIDDNIDTYIGVKYMSSLFGTANMIGYRTPKYRQRQMVESLEALGQSVFGNHPKAWEVLRQAVAGGNGDEVQSVLKDIIVSKDYTRNERQAALDYAGEAFKLKGMEMGDIKSPKDDAEQRLSELYGEGYDLSDLRAINEAKGSYEISRKAMEKVLPPELMGMLDDDPKAVLEWMRENPEWSDEQKAAGIAFVNNTARYNGILDREKDNVEAEVQASNDAIDAKVNGTSQGGDGMIHPVTLKNGETVYVTNGNVVANNAGGIDTGKSSDELVVATEDGEVKMIPASDVVSIEDVMEPGAMKQEAENNIRQAAQVLTDTEDAGTDTGTEASGSDTTTQEPSTNEANVPFDESGNPVFKINDTFVLEVDGERIPGQVTREVDDNGKIEVYTDKPVDGKTMHEYTPEEFAQMVKVYHPASEPGTVNNVQAPVQQELPNSDNNISGAGAPGQTQTHSVDNGNPVAAQETPVAGEQAPTQQGELSNDGNIVSDLNAPMPMKEVDGKQRVDYNRATPERAAHHIYNEKGYSEEEADEMVANTIAKKQKTFEEKAKALDEANAEVAALEGVRPTTPLTEETEDEYNAEKAEIEQRKSEAQASAQQAGQELQAAQNELSHWQNIQAARAQMQAAPVNEQTQQGEQPTEQLPNNDNNEGNEQPVANEENSPRMSTASEQAPTQQSEQNPNSKREGEAAGQRMKERIAKLGEQIRAKVEKIAEACAIPSHIIESEEDLDKYPKYIRDEVRKAIKAGKRVRGFYDPKSGHMFFYLPGLASEKDVDETYAHETVAHGGLRELLRDRKTGSTAAFDELCDKVWNLMSVRDQARYLDYVGVKSLKDVTQEKKRAAADEYMAHLSDGQQQNRTSTVKKVLRAISEIIQKVFKKRGINLDIKSDEDIMALLKASRKNLSEVDKAAIMQWVSDSLDDSEDGKLRMSTVSIFDGAGFEAEQIDENGNSVPMTDAEGNMVVKMGGKEFSAKNPIKASDLNVKAGEETSVLQMLVNDAKEVNNLSEKRAKKIYQNYADILNMYLRMGSAEMGGPDAVERNWQWLGETVYRTIAANGDAQYSYSMDIIKVCKKNEAVIKAMSAHQLLSGRGATPSEIVEIYRKTYSEGYQVPCPVCYVFTRYIRNGKYASAAIRGMETYGEHLPGGSDVWTVKQWLDELDRLNRLTNSKYEPKGKETDEQKDARVKEAKRYEKALADANEITVEYEKRINALSYELTSGVSKEREKEIMDEIKVMDARYQGAIDVISFQALTNWIKTFAIEEKSKKWRMREDAKKPEDMNDFRANALDLRLTANTMVNYPAIQRLRKSGGSAAGKEITFASNNELGEVVSGLGINKTNLGLYANPYQQFLAATDPKEKAKLRKKAKERFKDASVYAAMQTLRGGQRMWSWSDNIERLGPDVAINLMQLELLDGAMQTYSKQLEGVKLTAQMGAYVNGSLMAKDNGFLEVSKDEVYERDGQLWLKEDKKETVEEPQVGGEVVPRERVYVGKDSHVYQAQDGKLYVLQYDDVIGIDPFGNRTIKDKDGNDKKAKGLFELNDELDKAGNILVGMNDLHIRAALADPRVFFVIPWHSSGANNHILAEMFAILGQRIDSSVDYQSMQEEKNMGSRDKDSKKLPAVTQRLRDLWNEGKKWAKENGWTSGMDVDSDGDLLTEDQYMYRQLRALIFNGTIFEEMPSEEKYNEAVETYEKLDEDITAWENQKEGANEETKKWLGKQIDNARPKRNAAQHIIELHDGLIDWRDSDVNKNDEHWQRHHPKRINVEEARAMVLEDEFLKQVYRRVEPIGHMTNGDNTYIYPYEYWDENSTYDTADVNGKRYVEYCRRMGYKPKFSGDWKTKDESKQDVGNFVHDPGYWKLLIDRRMYDRAGKYQWLDPVSSEDFNTDLINPEETQHEFHVTTVADDAAADSIASKVFEEEKRRSPNGFAYAQYTKPMDKVLDDFEDAMAGNVRFSTVAAPVFYSNAERAVENVKQNKATAEQWKAMLTKAGGIKAGEDKWMGLSEWLDENKGKSLTKDEVLQFVRDNGIQMEEVNYGDMESTPLFQELNKEYLDIAENTQEVYEKHAKNFADFHNEMEKKYGEDFQLSELTPQERNKYTVLLRKQEESDPEINDPYDIAFREMGDRHGGDFEAGFAGGENGLEVFDSEIAGAYLGTGNLINATRLNYTTYGLDNKREIAFKVPSIEPYKEHDEIHFGPENEGKAVMWVRFGETTDADGKRVLVIDEIQSNRHQKGREKGYVNRKEAINQIEELKAKFDDVLKEREDKLDQIAKRTGITDEGDLDYYIIKNQHEKDVEELFNLDEIAGTYQEKIESLESVAEGDYSGGEVPDAPFEKNWHEVAMKRMLRLAAEEGFDKVAWTTGEQQAERYDMGRVVKGIRASDWQDDFLGWKDVKTIDAPFQNDNELQLVVDRNGKIVADINDNYDGRDLSELFGKEIADKLMGDGQVELEDAALRIGGKGMKGFYDQMLPRFMDKYGKKWGVKTGTVELPNVEEAGRTMHAVDVTPEMKESVMQGQLLFSTKSANESLGAPWQGSKGRHAMRLIEKLPGGKRFVDLFAGGGAMTHGAIVSGKYESYLMNDVNPLGMEMFMQGARGDWDNYDRESMTPEEFAQVKGTPEGMVWSYGGLGRNVDRSGVNARRAINRMKRLGELKPEAGKIATKVGSYKNVKLKQGDVVYADLPYEGTGTRGYGNGNAFDKEAFNAWAQKQNVPVFVSETTMPEGWTEIDAFDIKAMKGKRTEKLWVQDKFAEQYGPNSVEDIDAPQAEAEANNLRFSVVEDPMEVAMLEDDLNRNGFEVRYRAMVKVGDGYVNPMASKLDGKMRPSLKDGKWEKSEEQNIEFTPEMLEQMAALDAKNGGGYVDIIPGRVRYIKDNKAKAGTKGRIKFHLVKSNGKDLWAAYNPYLHSSDTPLNDQFKEAWNRPDMVVVKVLVPKSDIESGYKAEHAKDKVGNTPWHSGTVNSALPKEEQRTVTLSRYSKIMGEVSDSEAADMIAKKLKKYGVSVPFNTVTPSLREALVERGVQITEPEKKTGKECAEAYEAWKADSGLRFSTVDRTMMGIHNITSSKLRSALKLGGLANPSMAVIDTEVGGFEDFGEISLIPSSALIDKKTGRNAGTWGADAYTPRFPHMHRRLGKGGEKKMNKWVNSLGMNSEMEYNTLQQFNDYYNGFDIKDNALVYPYLFEKGLADTVAKYDHTAVNPRYIAFIEEYNGDLNALMEAYSTNPEVRERISNAIIADYLADSVKKEEGESFQEYRKKRAEMRKLITEALASEDGMVADSEAENIMRKQCEAYRQPGRFLAEDTRQAAAMYIDKNGLREEYTKWFENKMNDLGVEMQIYSGSDSQGRSKFKPANLEDISKQMKKQGRVASESVMFNNSPGAIRAKLLGSMSSLSQIKGERGRLVDADEFEDIRDNFNDEVRSYANTYTEGNYERLSELLESSNIRDAAKRIGIDLNEEDVKDLEEFKQRIIALPTEYFETKFERPVMLNEFRAAVVPKDIDEDLRAGLEEAGLDVREYDPEDEEDRTRVTMEAAKAAGNVLFSTVDAVSALRDDERVKNGLLGKVFSSLSEGARRGIVSDAIANRDYDFGAATEDWLSGLADDETFGNVPAADWKNVKRALRDVLREQGVEGPMSDNEARYVLWSAVQADDGVFSKAADVVMRERLGIGEETAPVAAEPQESGLRFSVVPMERAIARDYYERIMQSGRWQWLESMQDSMLSLKKLMQGVMGDAWKTIDDVPENENAYLAENLLSSMTAAQQQAYYSEFIKPLLKEVSRLCKGRGREKKRQELTDYLLAKHGLERNKVLADRDAQETAAAGGDYQDAYDANRERDYSGLTALTGETDVHAAEAAAQQMVDEYEAAHDTTALWDMIRAATQTALDKQYKSGLMSHETYQKVSNMFEYYVPLRGWEETTSDQVYGYLNGKGAAGGSIAKRAKGRRSKADDPIATIAKMGDDAIRQGNRNLMKQRFLNFVLNHPSDLVSVSELWLKYNDVTNEWEPVFADIPADATAEEVEQIVEQFEQDMEQLAQQEPDKYKHGRDAANIPYRVVPGNEREHQVLVKRGGNTFVLTINGNPRAAQALNGLTNPDVEMKGSWANIIKGSEWVNRTLSALYTTLSPAFIVSNFARDTIYSNTMAWIKESPNYAARFNLNYLRLNPVIIRRLLGKWEKGTLDDSKPVEKYFKEFMLHGGETGFAIVQDMETYKKKVAKELGMSDKKGVKKAINKMTPDIMKKGWNILAAQYELLGRSIENCARFAAYMTSRQMGRMADRSAFDAKEISVNFNKKGSGGKLIGTMDRFSLGWWGALASGLARSLYTFWNAGVQGMTNAGRAVKRHPVKATLMGIGPLYTLGFLQPVLAAMMCGGDGDDENSYYNLPEYVRRSNICIYIGGKWLTIPLPIEFRAIYGLGELTYGVISGNERYSNEDLAMNIGSQVSQLLPIDMLEGGGGFHPFIPTLFKPLVEAQQNKSWSGLPIYKDSPYNQDDPEYTKAYKNANEWIVAGAEWLNAATGGNEYKKGWIDINPAKIEYMLKGYLGGIYTTIDEFRRAGETAFGDREFEWRNVPLANRIIKQGDERTEYRKLREEYFKYQKEYKETKRLIGKYENAENTDVYNYAKILSDLNYSKEYGRYLIFEKYAGILEGLMKARKGESDKEAIAENEANELKVMRMLVDEMHAYEDGKLTMARPKLEQKDKTKDPNYIYDSLSDSQDKKEDNLLKDAEARAKREGDIGKTKFIASARKRIGKMKKALVHGNAESIMQGIRNFRSAIVRNLTNTKPEQDAWDNYVESLAEDYDDELDQVEMPEDDEEEYEDE